jgi:plasmid stability protein
MIAMIAKEKMASITIRKLDESTKARLRIRAAYNKRSMEDEARSILRTALAAEFTPVSNLAQTIHRRFKALGGIDLQLPVRAPMREPPKLGK